MSTATSEPPPSLWTLLREDLRTYERDFSEGGLWVTMLHRVGRRVDAIPAPALKRPLGGVVRGLSTLASFTFGIHFAPEMELGRRIRLWHSGGVRLRARRIGDDVHLRPNTTFGSAPGAPDDPSHWPVIGDRADIGAGACVLGGVSVGDGALVGACTLVLEDVPPGAAMLGVPGRILPKRR